MELYGHSSKYGPICYVLTVMNGVSAATGILILTCYRFQPVSPVYCHSSAILAENFNLLAARLFQALLGDKFLNGMLSNL